MFNKFFDKGIEVNGNIVMTHANEVPVEEAHMERISYVSRSKTTVEKIG